MPCAAGIWPVPPSTSPARNRCPADNPLWELPNLLMSPHSSTSQDRYFEMIFELFVDNLGRYVSGQPLRNQVDLSSGYC